MHNTYIRNFLTNHVLNSDTPIGRKYIEDPTVMGFNLFFDFDFQSPLLNVTSEGENAYNYLLAIGEPERAAKLRDFRDRLQHLISVTPYFFKKVSGLSSIYKLEKGISMEKDRKITIDTFESIDQRIGSLVNLYSEICYDFVYRRMILPVNMRRFNVVVVVSEIRNFRTVVSKMLNSKTQYDYVDLAPYIDTYAFRYKNSEFDFTESNIFLDDISNETLAIAENKFSILCGNFENFSRVGLLDLDSAGLTSELLLNKTANKNNPKNQINGILKSPSNTERSPLALPFTTNDEQLDQILTDTLNKTVANAENQINATLSDKFFNVINAKARGAQFGNVLYRGQTFDLDSQLSGNQNLSDVNPVSGRNPFTDYSKKVAEDIIKSGSVKRDTNNLNNIAKEDIIKTILQSQSNLGQAFTPETFLDGVIVSTLGQIDLGK